MFNQLKDKADIAVCCPIIDTKRAKDGICDGYRYYSFRMYNDEYHSKVTFQGNYKRF